MANVKKIQGGYSITGVTIQVRVMRDADGYLLNDADGAFAAAPADSLVDLTEHATLKGLYEKDESRTAWNDGSYTVTYYVSTDLNVAIIIGKIDIVDDLESVNVDAISGDRTAVDNIESTYDGTGYTDDNAPATQSQVGLLSTGSAAISVQAESYTLTTGAESSGGVADTETVNATHHEHTDDAGAIELYYQFDVGGAGVGVDVTVTGRINGNNDDLDGVYAYNWAGPSWDRIGDFEGVAGSTDGVNTYNLLARHTGTGANLGKVRIRFYAASGLTTATLRVDQIFTSYSVVSQSVGYANGGVWIDTVDGVAGTESFVNGVADNPVDNINDANTIADNLALHRFEVTSDSSIILVASQANDVFNGHGYLLALNGQAITGAFILGANVSGVGTTAGSEIHFHDCELGTLTLGVSHFKDCGLTDVLTFSEAGTYTLQSCYSGIAGSATPTVDFGAAVGNSALNMRDYSGGVEIENMKAGDTMSLEGQGQLVINANCTGGEISIRGLFRVTDNSGGAITITYDDMVDKIINLHDEAFGTWTFDPLGLTLTLKRVDGSTLQVFNLTDTTATINPILTRTPQ